MQQKDGMYNELAKAKIQDKRNVVVSVCTKGGYTIAQQIEVTDGPRVINVFLKGALHVDSLQGLYNLRDALNVAIEAEEPKSNNDKSVQEWDN